MKELTILLEFMLKTSYFDFSHIISKDLPLLLQFQKLDINDYLNISKSEENKQDHNLKVCNFEQALSSNKLPLFGSEDLKIRYIWEE